MSDDRFRPSELAEMRRAAEAFREEYKAPGLSVAIACRGRIVLTEAFGWADIERREPLTPKHRMRIASVSKPITAAAVLLLAERGKLSLDQRVFGDGALLGTRYGRKPYDERVRAITVEHLLSHTAGGWSNERNDPMFMDFRLTHAQLIARTLDTRPLEHDPGTHYAYSNFGYCLLGRIVEAVSGRGYERCVRESLLEPAGANGLAMALPDAAERLRDEVRYYPQDDGDPTQIPVARMDAHGGWVATPSDLVRFALRVDGFPDPPDLLSADSIARMTTPGKVNAGYALGWSVNRSKNWWHNGALPGSSAIMVRTSSGFCWAALANTRRRGDEMNLALDTLIWKMVGCITEWPGR